MGGGYGSSMRPNYLRIALTDLRRFLELEENTPLRITYEPSVDAVYIESIPARKVHTSEAVSLHLEVGRPNADDSIPR